MMIMDGDTRESVRSDRRPFWGAAGALALSCALAIGGLVAASPASAGACDKTGGSSDSLIWTGSGYTCAYVDGNGDASIGQGRTHTWTSSTAKGYTKRYSCDGQTGGVSVFYIYSDSAGTGLGSSITYTAFNGSSGDRHWHAAVLWNTKSKGSAADDQFVHNCSTDYTIAASLAYVSRVSLSGPSTSAPGQPVTFTASVTAPDGGTRPKGTVVLYKQAVLGVNNPLRKDCRGRVVGGADTPIASAELTSGRKFFGSRKAQITTPPLPPGTYGIYAAYGGTPSSDAGLPAYCLEAPQPGLTPAVAEESITLTVGAPEGQPAAAATGGARTASTVAPAATRAKNPKLTVVNRSTIMPKPLSARCPTGTAAVQVSISSPSFVINAEGLKRLASGKVTLSRKGIPAGTEIDLQLVCRPKKAPAMMVGRMGYGSVHADTMATTKPKSVLFGGFGNDKLSVGKKRGLAVGGPGNDGIALFASQTAGDGGPGSDWIRSYARGKSLIVGGLGYDVLIGGPGATLIVAADGRGGDVVICQSTRNKVVADDGDVVQGPCATIKRVRPRT